MVWPIWNNPAAIGSTSTRMLSIYATYSQSGPTLLLAEGIVNPIHVTDTTPEFSAIHNDPVSGDSATQYRIQVSTSTLFSSVFWDSGTTSMSTIAAGSRSPDISYAGPALSAGTTYYWRIKFIDAGGDATYYSPFATFSLAGSGSGGQKVFAYYGNWSIYGNDYTIKDIDTSGAASRLTHIVY